MQITQVGYAPNFMGWSPKSKKDKNSVSEVNKLLKTSNVNSIAISGHVNPDGDAIGSTLAMGYLLNKKTGIRPDVYIFGDIPKRFSYLIDDKNINLIKENSNFDNKNYDLVVSVDVPSLSYMPAQFVDKVFKNAKNTLKVDHHMTKDNFADINIADSKTSSAAQVVMQLVDGLEIEPKTLPKEFNESVYTGLITDTKNFSVATNESTFKDAALLVKNGLNTEKVNEQTYSNIPQEITGLLNLARQKVKFSQDGKLVYLYYDKEFEDYKKSILRPDLEYDIRNRLKDLTNDLRKTEGVEVSIYMTPEIKNGKNYLYISGRSNQIDINELATRFGRPGHKKAAGFFLPVEISADETAKKAVKIYEDYIKEKS